MGAVEVLYCSCSAQFIYAAIAQPVERILGKDEVASSNLASSSIFLTSTSDLNGQMQRG